VCCTHLNSWARPRGPGVLAEHFVSLKKGLIRLPEDESFPPHPGEFQHPVQGK
jgi:hypothetical protein